MSDLNIAVLVGSLRKDSFNRKLADALPALAADGVRFEVQRIDDLPLYNQDDDAKPPEAARRLKQAITSADGVLFVTPEYNRSVPGVLKNAIDHASRPYGQSAFAGKPAGILGVSIGAIGTACAQQHLRTILAYLDMPTLGQPEMFLAANKVLEDDGGIASGSRDFIQGWLDAYIGFVRKHAG
ncbi:NAD(P)H-dependent oxidoreductase [Luteimonas yindakuii]|uniref:NADPH-dependent FMN reductase n=1 Tax=Luteimonas yindakuii TaxID=2565782 RepID=UPI0010A43BCA|nr:NAD(P)H-dependent oxidoreductase [Luteimonas yindakuii]QCO67994.1 NAD(P)H-dependent oxidoreductase [Luteimonas yindakuii]